MNSTHNYKYLVVEDESLIRKNLIKKITALDLPLVSGGEAANGMDAMVLIEKNCPDLVITDIRMPGCGGLELAQYLHKNYPHVKTIIISGYNDFSYAQTAIKYNVKDYLLKPVTLEALSASLQKLLISIDADYLKQRSSGNQTEKLDQNAIFTLMEQYLRENYQHDVSLQELAEKFGFTPEYLGKIFKKHSGEPPSKYLTKLRMNEAKRLLLNQPDLEIQRVGELVGYRDGFYFSRAFKAYTGIQPSEFRNSQNI